MNLAALTAGVDRPLGTYEETDRLYDYLTSFIEGATLGFYTGDVDEKRAEIQEKLEAFDDEFHESASNFVDIFWKNLKKVRSKKVISLRDVLLVLLRNEDKVPMTRESLRREQLSIFSWGAYVRYCFN